jgi:CubicO group peptidase (beta-lactamase class C family)
MVARVSGKSFEDFCRDRIFQPLAMKDTFFGLTDFDDQRFARRYGKHPSPSLDAYMAFAEDPRYRIYWGVCSTALDLATFGQMFLQGGNCGDARILRSATVREMTRSHTPRVQWEFDGELFPRVDWGLGWEIQGEKHDRSVETRCSARTYGHVGGGGTYLWIDPVSEVVGVFFSTRPKGTHDTKIPLRHGGLFVEAIMAAIDT